MARANLKVASELSDAWKASHDGSTAPVRFFLLRVDADSATVGLEGIRSAAGSPRSVPPAVGESSAKSVEDTASSTKDSEEPADSAKSAEETAGSVVEGAGASGDSKSSEESKSSEVDPLAVTFELLREELGDGKKCMLALFAHDMSDYHECQWTVVSYVPDDIHPKSKMMVAAARDDVKKALDAARFTPDYHITDADDLTLAAFRMWGDRSDRQSAMSQMEIMKERVIEESNAARIMSGTRMAVVATVPFKMGAEVGEALAAVKGESPSVNLVEVAVVADTISIVSKRTLEGGVPEFTAAIQAAAAAPAPLPNENPLSPTVHTAKVEPRYFIVRLGAATMPSLLFYCPEGTAPRARMTYSTAKAFLLDTAKDAGVAFGRVVDARDDDDLLSALTDISEGKINVVIDSDAPMGSPSHSRFGSGGLVALPGMAGFGSPRTPRTPGGSLSAASLSEAGGSATSETGGDDGSFAKPSRPGKGAARVIGGVGLPGLSPRGVALPGFSPR